VESIIKREKERCPELLLVLSEIKGLLPKCAFIMQMANRNQINIFSLFYPMKTENMSHQLYIPSSIRVLYVTV